MSARNPAPKVTVITITRTRPELLMRAVAAVARQQAAFAFAHHIIVDDCAATVAMLSQAQLPANAAWTLRARQPWEVSGPGRSSRLRNIGVRQAASPWIAFLDDDNTLEPNHLQSLVERAEACGVRAAHSHMRMFHRDGRPYAENRVPWSRDPDEARAKFDELVALGVAQRGSNLFRDRADPLGHPQPARTVDTGEWLLARDLLLARPFTDRFTAEDAAALTGEDDKLLNDLIEAREPIACTGLATLHYFVGGYSNMFETPFDDSFAWA
jgi:glycosyltransferase involved in cell wall biosynthesis